METNKCHECDLVFLRPQDLTGHLVRFHARRPVAATRVSYSEGNGSPRVVYVSPPF